MNFHSVRLCHTPMTGKRHLGRPRSVKSHVPLAAVRLQAEQYRKDPACVAGCASCSSAATGIASCGSESIAAFRPHAASSATRSAAQPIILAAAASPPWSCSRNAPPTELVRPTESLKVPSLVARFVFPPGIFVAGAVRPCIGTQPAQIEAALQHPRSVPGHHKSPIAPLAAPRLPVGSPPAFDDGAPARRGRHGIPRRLGGSNAACPQSRRWHLQPQRV
mmetsp:Transcript_69201/g.140184  ORF Transcript_69201/g.140184 Transcript_69201/m.140184 type:complete len:220 (+) Transcript_69201:64-723(+)